MNKTSSYISKIATIVGLTLGAFAISALAFTVAPSGGPSSCPAGYPGCDAPINVGNTTQTKSGALTLGGLGVLSSNFIFNPGTAPSVGQVLTALDTTGTIGWRTPSSPTNFSGAVVGGFMNNGDQCTYSTKWGSVTSTSESQTANLQCSCNTGSTRRMSGFAPGVGSSNSRTTYICVSN